MSTSISVLLLVACFIASAMARRRAARGGPAAVRYQLLATAFAVAALVVALASAWRVIADHRRTPAAPAADAR